MACFAICPAGSISLEFDELGFRYPKIEESTCISCGACKAVCPVSKSDSRCQDALATYAAFSRDDIRARSSSGAVFFHLAQSMIERGGTVAACCMTADFYGAEHALASSVEELGPLLGSKYVQSDTSKIYRDVKRELQQGHHVLFCGTPCQVAGLRACLNEGLTELLETIDIVCHGVPSPRIWREYLAYLEDAYGSRAQRVFFRDKRKGWQRYSLVVEFKNSSIYSSDVVEDLYLRGFVSDLYLRNSCHHCAFKGSKHMGDLTLGDFWGIGEIAPELYDGRGTSVIVVNTNVGSTMLNLIAEQLYMKKVDSKKAMEHNPSYFKSSSENYLRGWFIKRLGKTHIKSLLEAYCGNGFIAKLRRKVAHLLERW